MNRIFQLKKKLTKEHFMQSNLIRTFLQIIFV